MKGNTYYYTDYLQTITVQQQCIYLHCVTKIEFFDVLPAKTASLTLFFEENKPEKGWVVSLEGNESEISKTEIWIFMEPEQTILKNDP